MRRQSGRVGFAGILAGVTLAVTACTSTVAGEPASIDIGPLSTAEGTAQSLTDFAEAGAVHYTGSLVAADGAELTVDVNAMQTGEVFGAITVNGLGASIVVVNNTLYVKGNAQFWTGMAARFGVAGSDGAVLAGRWVKLPTSLIGVEFGEIFTPDIVSQTAGTVGERAGRDELAGNATKNVAGVETYVVDVDGGTVYLATSAPHGVARFELDRIGSQDTTSVSEVVLDVVDASARTVSHYQNLAKVASTDLTAAVDALTGIEQGEHRFERCGASSCSLVVDIENTGKSAVRVHLKADWTGDDAPLGSCEAKVGPVAPGASSTIGCTLDTSEWVSFYQRANSVPGTHPYGAQWSALVLADPPDTADLETWSAAKAPNAETAKTDGSHAVYRISYSGEVWKYGVVANQYWRDHTANQLPACLAQTRSACSASLVTVADNAAAAHALAAQLVAEHRTENGGCPAGQWVSCAAEV